MRRDKSLAQIWYHIKRYLHLSFINHSIANNKTKEFDWLIAMRRANLLTPVKWMTIHYSLERDKTANDCQNIWASKIQFGSFSLALKWRV